MSSMPPSWRSDFSLFIYGDFLRAVPMFRGVSEEIVAALCSITQPLNIIIDQVVFSEGSNGAEIYMLMKGELEVTMKGERLGFLSSG